MTNKSLKYINIVLLNAFHSNRLFYMVKLYFKFQMKKAKTHITGQGCKDPQNPASSSGSDEVG